jgi:hypothetical protein
MLDMYSLVFLFLHSIRGSLHITHTCTCIGGKIEILQGHGVVFVGLCCYSSLLADI